MSLDDLIHTMSFALMSSSQYNMVVFIQSCITTTDVLISSTIYFNIADCLHSTADLFRTPENGMCHVCKNVTAEDLTQYIPVNTYAR